MKLNNFKKIKKIALSPKPGIAMLMLVIIIGAAALVMAYTASFISLGDISMGYDAHRGAEAFSTADGCMEESLLRLRKDSTYTGGTLSFASSSCIIGVSGGGASRTIIATSTSDNYNSVLNGVIGINSNIITVTSWQEKEN